MVTHTYELQTMSGEVHSSTTIECYDTADGDARALGSFAELLAASDNLGAIVYAAPVEIDDGVQLELLADEWRPDKPVTVYRIVRLNTQEQPNDE